MRIVDIDFILKPEDPLFIGASTFSLTARFDASRYKNAEEVLLALIAELKEVHRKRYRPDLSGMEPGSVRHEARQDRPPE